MKKLMTAIAVAGLSAAVFGDVTSANVVGYQNRSMLDEEEAVMESYSGGPVFKAVGSAGDIYTLNDFNTLGMDCSGDCIQFLDPDTTEEYLLATYADAETYSAGWVGWWDYEDVGGTRIDGDEAEEFDACTAFLAMFSSGNEITFNFAGEVEDCEKEVVLATESPFVCNPQPVDFTLANVKAEGFDCSGDALQYLDPYTTEELLLVTYADEETYGKAWVGWWDYDDVGGTRVDEEPLLSGQGLLGIISSGNEILLTFDNPLKLTK